MNRPVPAEAYRIYEAACALTPEERPTFVSKQCAGDEELETWVLSLLAGADETLTRRRAGGLARLLRETPEASEPAEAAPTIPGYTIRGEINRGGQGVVYRAVQQSTGQVVAVKVLRDAWALDRFERERDVLARLRHPNIVRIIDYGTLATGAYFVMEYVDGGALTHGALRARTGGAGAQPGAAGGAGRAAKTPRAIVATFIEICEAVQVAHAAGVVHRDLKPGNIRIDGRGAPRILDFGLARLLNAEGEQTTTGGPLGTPKWMAPEQAAGNSREISPRTDVYALGNLLYWSLTGEMPFPMLEGEDGRVHNQRQILSAEPRDPRGLRRDVDPGLARILLTCLEKSPAQRFYENAGALADDLRRWLDGRPLRVPGQVWWDRGKRALLRRRTWIGLSAVVVLAAGVVWGVGSAENAKWRASEAGRIYGEAAALSPKRPLDAIARLDEALALDPDHFDSLLMKAIQQVRVDDRLAARQTAQRLIAAHPQTGAGEILLGRTYRGLDTPTAESWAARGRAKLDAHAGVPRPQRALLERLSEPETVESLDALAQMAAAETAEWAYLAHWFRAYVATELTFSRTWNALEWTSIHTAGVESADELRRDGVRDPLGDYVRGMLHVAKSERSDTAEERERSRAAALALLGVSAEDSITAPDAPYWFIDVGRARAYLAAIDRDRPQVDTESFDALANAAKAVARYSPSKAAETDDPRAMREYCSTSLAYSRAFMELASRFAPDSAEAVKYSGYVAALTDAITRTYLTLEARRRDEPIGDVFRSVADIHVHALVVHAQALLYAGKRDGAVELATRIEQIAGCDPAAARNWAIVVQERVAFDWLRCGEIATAEEIYIRLTRDGSNHYNVHQNYAKLLCVRADYVAARTHFEAARALAYEGFSPYRRWDPELNRANGEANELCAQLGLGVCWMAEGDAERAIAAWQSALRTCYPVRSESAAHTGYDLVEFWIQSAARLARLPDPEPILPGVSWARTPNPSKPEGAVKPGEADAPEEPLSGTAIRALFGDSSEAGPVWGVTATANQRCEHGFVRGAIAEARGDLDSAEIAYSEAIDSEARDQFEYYLSQIGLARVRGAAATEDASLGTATGTRGTE